jgi:hypothetical protein
MDLNKAITILRGIISNIIALVSPKLFIKVTQETGRGGDFNRDDELISYSKDVYNDYLRVLGKVINNPLDQLKDKIILEYGPGDFLGTGLIFLLNGAKRVYCIDRFPLVDKEKYLDVYKKIIQAYDSSSLKKWNDILGRDIIYISAENGVYQIPEKADFIVSRAVLEHCNDLDSTFKNMNYNLNTNGIMIHKADLTSHGTHRKSPLDFLTYSPIIWSLMTSQKGYPNRWRRNTYRELSNRNSFKIIFEESLYEFSKEELINIKPELASSFRNLVEEELLCSDYFFVAEKIDAR